MLCSANRRRACPRRQSRRPSDPAQASLPSREHHHRTAIPSLRAPSSAVSTTPAEQGQGRAPHARPASPPGWPSTGAVASTKRVMSRGPVHAHHARQQRARDPRNGGDVDVHVPIGAIAGRSPSRLAVWTASDTVSTTRLQLMIHAATVAVTTKPATGIVSRWARPPSWNSFITPSTLRLAVFANRAWVHLGQARSAELRGRCAPRGATATSAGTGRAALRPARRGTNGGISVASLSRPPRDSDRDCSTEALRRPRVTRLVRPAVEARGHSPRR